MLSDMFAAMAKKDSADPIEFLRGEIVGRYHDELLQQGLGLQMTVRRQYDPHPSTGACTAKNICTASILCLITEGSGRVGCGKTGVFRPDCPIKI
jgi:hypothetical protein